jgi:hypothetical protein
LGSLTDGLLLYLFNYYFIYFFDHKAIFRFICFFLGSCSLYFSRERERAYGKRTGKFTGECDYESHLQGVSGILQSKPKAHAVVRDDSLVSAGVHVYIG